MVTPSSANIHQSITEQIIAAIKVGTGTYQMPWNTRLCGQTSAIIPHNPIGHYGYRGVNVLMLWGAQHSKAYETAEWATFRQWRSAGAHVRQGEKGTPTVFYKTTGPNDCDDSNAGDSKPRRIFIARAAYVFNIAQVDDYEPPPLPILPEIDRHLAADRLIADSGATIHHGGPRACYIPGRDEIHLPPPGAFHGREAYYGVALHELTHWTGHGKRCSRDLSGRFGSQAYAAEELIAELGAAFLCAELGVTAEPRIDHAQYIKTWLSILQQDKFAIFLAAAKATEATNYLIRHAEEALVKTRGAATGSEETLASQVSCCAGHPVRIRQPTIMNE